MVFFPLILVPGPGHLVPARAIGFYRPPGTKVLQRGGGGSAGGRKSGAANRFVRAFLVICPPKRAIYDRLRPPAA